VSDEQEAQPPLTLHHVSFVRGELEGKPCVVVYDAATDKTTVIGFQSKGYGEALIALSVLEQAATPLPKSLRSSKTVILQARRPKLILPGSNASN
jgi:hypothetical protein